MNKKMKGRVMLSASKKPYISVRQGQEDVLETVKNSIEIITSAKNEFAQKNENGENA